MPLRFSLYSKTAESKSLLYGSLEMTTNQILEWMQNKTKDH